MRHCWARIPEMRPDFDMIIEHLAQNHLQSDMKATDCRQGLQILSPEAQEISLLSESPEISSSEISSSSEEEEAPVLPAHIAETYDPEKLLQISFDKIEYVSTLDDGKFRLLFQGMKKYTKMCITVYYIVSNPRTVS